MPVPSPITQENIESIVDIMKAVGDKHEQNVLAPFQSKARWAARRFGPFFPMENALLNGIPGSNPPPTEEERADFDRVMSLHPDLPRVIAGFQGEADAYKTFVDMMRIFLDKGRTDDTHTVKINIRDWIPTNPSQQSLETPLVGSKKDNRGFYNKETARPLTPLRLLDEFDEDPMLFMQKVQSGAIRISANDFPSFLYPAGTPYDPEQPEKDLFRGDIFLRALRCIYTGKGSALDGYRLASKDSMAEMHNMKEVFPEAAGVTALHVHFALSSLSTWNEIERGDFNYYRFFQNCVRLFTADPTDEWAVDTLEFLTKQMPGLKRKRKQAGNAEDRESDHESDQTTSILQRRAVQKAAREREAREHEENDAARHEENQRDDMVQDDRDDDLDHRYVPERHRLTPPLSSQPPVEGRLPLADLTNSPLTPVQPSRPLTESPSPPPARVRSERRITRGSATPGNTVRRAPPRAPTQTPARAPALSSSAGISRANLVTAGPSSTPADGMENHSVASAPPKLRAKTKAKKHRW